ncbi:hypothetical protein GIB67_007316 [Kingdonia uniflora]|uniref:EF-hand domain-containing protein n=1 Tax=Kingdonia uniflora TaxID=39325 RepID=A0A7J7NX70_9MAGN|nr:hypothetical protein GIB67_007316 [Kingdonia uniflora]
MEGWVIAETGAPSEEEKKKSKHKGLLRFSFVGVGASVAVMIAAIICKETETGVAQAIIRFVVDFKRDPWPKVVAENFSVEEVVGIKESFQLMDVNNNGKITLGEIKVGLGKIGHNVPDVDLQMLMEADDVDGNRTLDFGEYVAVAIHLRKIGNDEYLHKAFTFFDKNKSGYIEIEELRDSLAYEVDTNNEEVITAIIHDVNTKKFDSDEERLHDGHREKEPKDHAESGADSGGSLKVGPEKEGESEEDVSQDVSEEGSDYESEEEEEYEV